MIKKQNLGIHKDVLFATFGTGDISFSRGRFEDNKNHTLLVFRNNAEPRKIGDVCDEDKGKSTDELEKPEFVFEFSKPESITALIHSLVELQKNIFDNE